MYLKLQICPWRRPRTFHGPGESVGSSVSRAAVLNLGKRQRDLGSLFTAGPQAPSLKSWVSRSGWGGVQASAVLNFTPGESGADGQRPTQTLTQKALLKVSLAWSSAETTHPSLLLPPAFTLEQGRIGVKIPEE